MEDTKRKDRIAELYQALKKKKKYVARVCGDQPPENPLQSFSNSCNSTFLHMAIRFKQKDLVNELLGMLSEQIHPPLWNIKNKEGNTILHELACSDSVKNLAEKVLKICEYKDQKLLTARNEFGETPIFCAARHGQTEMFKFLAEKMKLKVVSVEAVMSPPEEMKLKESQELLNSQHHLQRDDKTTVLHISITTECFVCSSKDNNGNDDTSVTSYKRCSPILQELIKLLVEKDTSWHASIDSQEGGPSNTKNEVEIEHSYELFLKKDGQESLEIEGQNPQENKGQNSNNYKKSDETPLFLATISNIKEIVEEILICHPKELEHTNRKGMNILQVAILHRQEEIFYMLVKSEVLSRSLFLSTDDQGNSLLHMVGQNTKSQASEKMQNPAFQLRNELLFFQKVKSDCKMHLTKPLNNNHQTAEELFAASNEKLHQEAKEWLMRTGENCTILSVFIATVAFAAAYTVPGGSDGSTGIPILKCKPFFVVFIIADVISLTFALTSVGIFLSILTSTFPLQHFETYLLKKLTLGIKFMVFSVSMMAVAFGATIVLIMTHNWESIFWYVVAFLPVPIFFLSYSPLRSAVLMRSIELVKNFVPILLLPFLFPTYGAYKGQRWTKKKFRFCWNKTQSPQSTAARCTPV